MKRFFAPLAFVLSLASLPAMAQEAKPHELGMRCASAVSSEIQQGKGFSYWIKEHPMGKVSGFFSTTIDGCVGVAVDDLKNDWFISDIHNSLLRDDKGLFHCDRAGVDNVVLEKARL